MEASGLDEERVRKKSAVRRKAAAMRALLKVSMAGGSTGRRATVLCWCCRPGRS
jgi:hypothetical protein